MRAYAKRFLAFFALYMLCIACVGSFIALLWGAAWVIAYVHGLFGLASGGLTTILFAVVFFSAFFAFFTEG